MKDDPSRDVNQSRITGLERRVNVARHFNLLSDVFMSVALRDVDACQYVLRILTGQKNLIIEKVRTQYQISSIISHDVKLDVLAEDENRALYQLEIQRKNTINHTKRIRSYSSMIDSIFLHKGADYADLPEVYIIYISESDIWKGKCTIYPIIKEFENSHEPYTDGLHLLFINTAIDDGSEAAQLMQYFKNTDPDDMRFGALSARIHYLKKEEGGLQEMCEISEIIYEEGRQDGRQEGKQETQYETALALDQHGMPIEEIASILKVILPQLHEWLTSSIPEVESHS